MKASKKGKSTRVEAPPVEAAAPDTPKPEWLLWAVGLALALVPCFWQSRIQANDLGSHIYNAWLAHLVEAGQAPGLAVVPLTTNVLFDLVLKAFFERFGADAAQRIAVAGAVLIFVSGAFSFVRRVSGSRSWALFPMVVMLAYGWTFHMGLFNFYLSLGLSFWALALAWSGGGARLAGAAALLVVAYVAHGLPVAWSAAVLAYRLVAERLDDRQRKQLFVGALAAIAVGTVVLRLTRETKWYWDQQVHAMFGADQLWVYDYKSVAAALVLFAIWTVLAMPIFRPGVARLLLDLPFQICALVSVGILLIPSWILLPGFGHPLVYLSDRMSLALAVCVCAFVARTKVARPILYGIGALTVYFFGTVYIDEGALNQFEDGLTTIVRQLPAGQRVLAPFGSYERINGVWHAIDRVCIGHCYSYGNYEPSSRQFRIRATGPSPVVMTEEIALDSLMRGSWTPKERELPVYEVYMDNTPRLNVRSLGLGDQSLVFKSHLSTMSDGR